jgi:hypothetical protein
LIDGSSRLEGYVGFHDADVFAPAKLLKENRIGIVAGIIAGYPDDTAETIRQRFDHFLTLNPAMIYAQYLTPYPKTVLRDEMLKDGLVANVDDFTKYDGFTIISDSTWTRSYPEFTFYARVFMLIKTSIQIRQAMIPSGLPGKLSFEWTSTAHKAPLSWGQSLASRPPGTATTLPATPSSCPPCW